MPKVIDDDRARRKILLEQKRAARKAAAAQKEEIAPKDVILKLTSCANPSELESSNGHHDKYCYLLSLPEDAICNIFCMLPAADLGRLTLTCKQLNQLLPDARIPHVLSRLNRPLALSAKKTTPHSWRWLLCRTEADARVILAQSTAGGNTGRVVPCGKYAKQVCNEYISYARFLEEAVCGYSTLSTSVTKNVSTESDHGNTILLPRFVQGRFATCSPEHSLCRVGGDGSFCGAGGSGVASWGVGRRGQLGHGQRHDERWPRRFLGGLGYASGLRIVQVSAGGGLVRVAHSLLLTDTGRVLSFGCGQYGALGHGYTKAGKQLPDMLRPQYIDALSHVRCVCVAAGELHSAVVTSDGDVYSWGDGFCGQLGHGDKRPQLEPKQITQGGLQDEIVSMISCGSRHTLAVTEDGEAFSFGLGHFGVLGRSYTPFDYDADAAVVAFTTTVRGEEADVGLPENVGAAAGAPLDAPVVRDFAAELVAHLELIANLSLDDSSDQCIPQLIDSLKGITIVGASAGHRHSLLLDSNGALYSFGSASNSGCLGHGDCFSQRYPARITAFDEDNVKIVQMSAGVDISMAVSTTGDVYAWGKTDGGRIGLGLTKSSVTLPRRVKLKNYDSQKTNGAENISAVDVECGYVHSLIVGVDGRLHICGGVGVEGEEDGQQQDEGADSLELGDCVGQARPIADFNIWHRLPEPQENVKKERWKKLGKYEVKGRSKMLSDPFDYT